jgi:hypothetical protein
MEMENGRLRKEKGKKKFTCLLNGLDMQSHMEEKQQWQQNEV